MPCRCDDYQGSYSAYNGAKSLRSKEKKHLDRVTQLLCYLIGELIEDGLWAKYAANAKPLLDWRIRHHRRDTKRVSRKMDEFLSSHPKYDANELANWFISKAEAVHPVSRWHRKWFVDMASVACARHDGSQRKKDEHKALVKRAMDKLTKEERKALGI